MIRIHPRLNEWAEELIAKRKATIVCGELKFEMRIDDVTTPEGYVLNPEYENTPPNWPIFLNPKFSVKYK